MPETLWSQRKRALLHPSCTSPKGGEWAGERASLGERPVDDLHVILIWHVILMVVPRNPCPPCSCQLGIRVAVRAGEEPEEEQELFVQALLVLLSGHHPVRHDTVDRHLLDDLLDHLALHWHLRELILRRGSSPGVAPWLGRFQFGGLWAVGLIPSAQEWFRRDRGFLFCFFLQ